MHGAIGDHAEIRKRAAVVDTYQHPHGVLLPTGE
jgi:hypothetical protein